ncbi:MAG: GT2 family glycosyltransferase [Paraglaciecola sp.]|jgi:GT2 family glycosyltransferase
MNLENKPFISILTVNYRKTKTTCNLLQSIKKNSYKNLEVIVVDNGSLKDNDRVFGRSYPGVVVIRSIENIGFAGGNNLGIGQACGEFLFFVNNDTVFTNGLVEHLLQAFKRPDVGMASPKIKYFNQPDTIQYADFTPINKFTVRNKLIGKGEKDKEQHDLAKAVAYGHGAAIMVRKSVMQAAGMMSKDYFLYYEELDWCQQIRKAGFTIFFEPKAVIYHKESLAIGKESPIKVFYKNRNRIWYIKRNKQGISLVLFFLFLLFITIPTHTISYIFRNKLDLFVAFYRGIIKGFSNRNLRVVKDNRRVFP